MPTDFPSYWSGGRTFEDRERQQMKLRRSHRRRQRRLKQREAAHAD